jgi:signal peptidase II
MRKLIYIFTLFAIILLDRLMKIVIVNGWEFDGGILHLERFDNHGLVFSIPSSPVIAITMVSLVIVSFGAWLTRQRKKLSPQIIFAVGCILVGAVSNLLDRVWYGVVIDWISFGRWFPIFNIADVSIFLGVILWVRDLTKAKRTS